MSHGPAKKNAMQKKIVILFLVLLSTFAVVVTGISHWEKKQQQEALLQQEEIDKAARRRREGWIQKDDAWYAPKLSIETMLLIGLDTLEPLKPSESYNNDVQSDFLLLAIFDAAEEETTVLHINRDTMAEIPVLGITGQPAGTMTGQLALAHTYGSGMQDSCANTVEAVKNFLGVPINHYVSIGMGAVPYLNDMIGGVTVTVLDDFSGVDDTLVKGDTITLKGEQALHYVRLRKGLEDSSNLRRMERQRQYLLSAAEKIEKLGADFTPTAQQLAQVLPYMVSDCTVDTLSRMAKQFGTYPIKSVQDIRGEAVKGEEYMEFYPDEEALQQQVLQIFYDRIEE